MARILLLGCGQLTSQLPAFTQHELIGIRRSNTQTEGVEMLACDLNDIAALAHTLRSIGEVDAVVFSATPKQRLVPAYKATYVDIPNKVITLFAKLGWQPYWLHISSTGVFHQNSGEYVHENTQPAPQNQFAQILRQSECVIENYGKGAVLRLGGLYGQGRTHLLNSLKAGRRIQNWPWSYTNRIHREDAARAIAFVLDDLLSGKTSKSQNAQSKSSISYFHGVDHDPAPLHEVVDFLTAHHQLPMPEYFSVRGADAIPTQNKRVGNRKLVEAGFQFRYPSYRQGFTLG